MKRFAFSMLMVASVFGAQTNAWAETDVSKAREALSKKEDDSDADKALEEVFEAAAKNYSSLKKGTMSLNYSADYSYSADQRINLQIKDGAVLNLDVIPTATHNFTNNFSYDYGLLDNVTLSGRLPLVAKFDTADDLSNTSVGDISGTVRWQPWSYEPGVMSKTLFSSLKLKTGDSPYEVDPTKNLSSGSGYYSLSFGASASKVLDPVVLFGSLSYSYGIPETDLNQVRGGFILQEVHPGSSYSFSMGFAYSLSYDISFSGSFQGSYNDKTEFKYLGGATAKTSSQTSGIINTSLGIRVSPETIANVSVGFGLTEDSPDILLGLSLPIDISGIKASD